MSVFSVEGYFGPRMSKVPLPADNWTVVQVVAVYSSTLLYSTPAQGVGKQILLRMSRKGGDRVHPNRSSSFSPRSDLSSSPLRDARDCTVTSHLASPIT